MTVQTETFTKLAKLANTLRIDSIKATTAAGSGHPTSCMSAAELMAAVFFDEMHWDPQNPRVPGRDRFVLSKGHAAPVLYSVLKEAGAIPNLELTDLRKFGNLLEGHPTPHLPWIDVSTGSLGQGLSCGLGMALAIRLDKSPARVFVLLGDGEAAEGNVWEALNLAGHDNIDNLVALFDINRLGQSDPTMIEHHMDVYARRLEAFGWDTQVINGHDMGEVVRALEQTREPKGKPFAILARTEKGKGVSFVEGKNGWHGKPFKKGEEADKAIAEVEAKGVEKGSEFRIQPPMYRVADVEITVAKPLTLPAFKLGDAVATREAYGGALVALGHARSDVVAMDADVKNSTYSEKFKEAFPDRFFDCYIAEQNMVAMAAGISTVAKIPFVSTFACFLSRAYDQVRMGGISMANMKLCGSHAGVSIGEDGPSQMALEDIAMFRAVPGGIVLYPCDATSTYRLVELAAQDKGIAYIRTSRPKTPILYGPDETFALGGFKVFRGSAEKCVVISAGVTLHEARKAQEQLKSEGIEVAVVDLYCIKPLNEKDLQALVKQCGNRVVTVEDHYPEGGLGDAVLDALATTKAQVWKVAVRELPKSGKPEELLAYFGIDAAGIARKVKEIL